MTKKLELMQVRSLDELKTEAGREAARENHRRFLKRTAYKVMADQSGCKRCGYPDQMKAPENWKDQFQKDFGWNTDKQERGEA